MSNDVLLTLDPALHADLLDGVDVGFQWHIILIGFLRTRGVTTSGRLYADELQICLESRAISPPYINTGNPLVNCYAYVSVCSSLGIYSKGKARKTCLTEFATNMESQHVRILSMPGCYIA